jgi:hypothetical protein
LKISLENGSGKQARRGRRKVSGLSVAGNERAKSAKEKSENLNKGKGENVTGKKK